MDRFSIVECEECGEFCEDAYPEKRKCCGKKLCDNCAQYGQHANMNCSMCGKLRCAWCWYELEPKKVVCIDCVPRV